MKSLFNVLLICSIIVLTNIMSYSQVVDFPINKGWKFKQVGHSEWTGASVPGTIHTDLRSAGKIGDPYYRTNEKDLQWIDKTDWEYRTFFDIDQPTISKTDMILRFEGLDTYADVWLNGNLILQANNMFRTWEVDVRKFVRLGKNELYVLLKSPVNIGLKKLSALGYPLPASNDQSVMGGLGDKQVSIFIRKAGYHFGWDWGPRLVTSGIWRPVKLIAWDKARITDLYIIQKHMSATSAEFIAELEINADISSDCICSIDVNKKSTAYQKLSLVKGFNKVKIAFNIKDPQLWWPNGLGAHNLYNISAAIELNGIKLDCKNQSIGIRTIEHIRKADPTGDGESFYFQVNGRPVFAKGANIIPNDIFLPSVTPEKYEFIVKSAAKANINMLRVWGGGVYEDNLFYDLCDKYGIMIWQDFMFACSMYPGDDTFLENVRLEAIDNVKRIRNHPCIALWCGNNEIEIAWAQWDENRGWGWKQQYTAGQRNVIWHSYDTLFHKILPSVVMEFTNQPYWHSSPSQGIGQLSGNSGNKGDVHYWGVWHGKEPIENFRINKARFMSEYGFQSFPVLESVKKYTLPQDWNIESEVMAAHQRSGIGNLRIREYMDKSYKIPSDFEKFLYVGQLLQAEAIKTAIESHRSDMPFCMGSLYWQLNDCWPVASWSGIDSYLKLKAMHYFAGEAFKDRVLVSVPDSGFVKYYVVSDHLEQSSAVMNVKLMDFYGKTLFSKTYDIKIPANGSSLVATFDIKELKDSIPLEKVLVLCELKSGKKLIDEDIQYLTKPKFLDLPQTDVKFYVYKSHGKFYVDVSSKNLSKNVMIINDNYDVNFSNNFFDLLPGRMVTISCDPVDSKCSIANLEEFRKGIRVIYLNE